MTVEIPAPQAVEPSSQTLPIYNIICNGHSPERARSFEPAQTHSAPRSPVSVGRSEASPNHNSTCSSGLKHVEQGAQTPVPQVSLQSLSPTNCPSGVRGVDHGARSPEASGPPPPSVPLPFSTNSFENLSLHSDRAPSSPASSSPARTSKSVAPSSCSKHQQAGRDSTCLSPAGSPGGRTTMPSSPQHIKQRRSDRNTLAPCMATGERSSSMPHTRHSATQLSVAVPSPRTPSPCHFAESMRMPGRMRPHPFGASTCRQMAFPPRPLVFGHVPC